MKNPYRYSGYQYDGETELYYLNARMYDPNNARFLQADTYLGDKNDPLSLNLYTYTKNNPNTYSDPSGNIPVLALLGKYAIDVGIDIVIQAAINYYFNPETAGNIGASFGAVEYVDSLIEGVIGLFAPGGKYAKTALESLYVPIKNQVEAGNFDIIRFFKDFAKEYVINILGDKLGDIIVKYGKKAIGNGLDKLGFNDNFIHKWTGLKPNADRIEKYHKGMADYFSNYGKSSYSSSKSSDVSTSSKSSSEAKVISLDKKRAEKQARQKIKNTSRNNELKATGTDGPVNNNVNDVGSSDSVVTSSSSFSSENVSKNDLSKKYSLYVKVSDRDEFGHSSLY